MKRIMKLSSGKVLSTGLVMLAALAAASRINKTLLTLLAGLTVISCKVFGGDVFYVAEEQLQRVSIVQPDGGLQTFANGVGLVYGLALDSHGNVYAAGTGDDTIREVTSGGGVSVYASASILGSPSGLAFDADGHLFTCGAGWGGTINRIGTNGMVTNILTGIGWNESLAFDVAGNLYVSCGAQVIKITPVGVISTYASGFNETWGLAFDRDGNLFVADAYENSVSKVTTNGVVSLYATGLDYPTGIAFDSSGDLYVCNITHSNVLGYLNRITPDGTVSTFASGLDYPTAIAIQQSVAPPSCTPPPPGLVGWWKGDGTAVDVVGGNNGVLVNVSYTNGMDGLAFACDPENYPYGTYTGVQIADQPAYALTNALTIEGWIRPRGDGYNIFWRGDNRPGTDPYYISMSGNHVLEFLIGDQNNNYDTVSTTLDYGVWVHVAATFDGSAGTMSLYTNGVLAAQKTTTIRPFGNLIAGDSPGIGIGNVNDGFNNFPFLGDIDEIALYSRALMPAEIQAIYNAGSAGKCISSQPAVPVISNFAPVSGTNGTVVTISGANFNATAAADIVYFGAVRATVLAASPTSLTVTVPTGATYAPITVTVGGLMAYANAPFLVTFAGGGTTALAPRLDLPAGDGPGFTAFADLDGDGKPDLLVLGGSVLSIYQNLGTNGTVAAGSFAPRVDLPLPAGLDAMTVADVDGDGKLDIVLLNRNSNQVMILQNLSAPGRLTTNSFATPVAFSTGSDPRGLAVQDLDGDGKPELIVGNWGDSTVSVFYNTGAGGITTNSFGPAVIFAVGANPQGLAVADLDGDGRPDIVTANNNYGTTNSVSILRNTSTPGNISFAPSVGLAGLPTSYGIAVGDLDGDGKLDLAVSSFINGQAVSVYRNTSAPGSLSTNSFAPNVDFSTGGWGNGVAIGDLDVDGKPDLAVVTQLPDHLSIFKNISLPGSFTTGSLAPRVDYPTGWNPNGIAIGDLDGDGRPDIAFAVTYAATLSIYQNETSSPGSTPGTNPPAITGVAPMISAPGTAISISGINFSPLAVSNIVYFGAVQGIVSSASPTNLFVTVPAGATFAPITVTVNGLTASSSRPFEPTFPGDGSSISSGSFAASFNLATGVNPGSAIIADLDGDGKPDIAEVNGNDHTVSIFRNISTNGALLSAASFAPRVDLPFPTDGTGGNPYRLRAVDLDGDGRLDLIACEVNGNRVSVFHNISSPGGLMTNSFEPAFALVAGNDCRFATAADLDGDGRVDIIALNYGDKTISLFKNVGTGGSLTTNSFAPPVVIAAPGGPYEAVVADLDGDGKPDLAVANSDSGTVSIYQNVTAAGAINTNSFAASIDLPCGNATATIMAGDLDGDGRLDLVAGSVQSETISVFQNVSSGGLLTSNSFAARVDFSTPGWMHTVTLADINGDGKPDICTVGELPSFLAVFQNVSTPGSFTTASLAPPVDFGTGWNAWGIAVGDLDGDGRPDIVFCNNYDSTITIYQNQTPFGTSPVITTQPTNQNVAVGGTATFSVAVQGASPLNFQWSFNGTNLVGATNATLTLNNVQPVQAGDYSVSVSNLAGMVTSSNAVLTVYVPPTPPAILAQTPGQVVLLGNAATFSVTAGGPGPLSYFWSRNGAVILNATNSSYTLLNAQLPDSGSQFSCLVTNAYGSAVSTNVSLKVIDSTLANDLCSGAIVITNASYTNVQSTAAATSFGDPTPDCVDGFGHGVWYQFTAPVAGLLVVDTFGSDFDTGLAIYTGSCDALTEVACNDDFGGVTSQVTLPTTAGTTYLILAGGYDADAGNLMLHLNHFAPPAFAVQPTNISVVVSSNGSFSPTLSGSLPMSFQWFFNNSPLTDGGRISGSTNSTLNIAGVQTGDGGYYFLVASNFVGVATSSVAVLTPVILPPVFLQPPLGGGVVVGSNANISVIVGGTPPFSYQWSFNSQPLVDDGLHIAGSATASLTISNFTTADAGDYLLTVTNLSGSASGTATLWALTPPAFVSPLLGRSVPPGLPTTFTAQVSGNPAPLYLWQLNGTNVQAWSPSGSYTIPAVGTNQLGFYQVIASNWIGSVTSTVAQLTFGPVAAWGLNSSGECLPPPGLSNVLAVAGSPGASFAVQSSGNLVAWGSASAANVPASATNIVAMAGLGNYALRADGSVVHWAGLDVSALSNIVSVAGGSSTAGYAVRAEGSLVTWGNPSPGLSLSALPAGLNHLTAIACGMNSPVGYLNAVALKNDGTIVVSGSGAVTNVPAGLNNVVAVAAGYSYAMALIADGTVVAWGSGTGTNLPAGLTNIVAISAGNVPGENFGLAIRADGTVVTWGDNPDGETNPPAALNNLVSIAGDAAAYHGLALVNNGSPVILHPPVGLTAYTGRDVTLQAFAAGAQPLSYQWLLNGTNVPGATNTSLVISNVQFNSAGNYQLSVSNSINTALSLAAPLTVISNSTLIFLSQPATQTNIYQGGKVQLGTTVLGSGPLSYQWYFSPTANSQIFTPVSGATNDSLTFDPALAGETGYYYVSANNNLSRIVSLPVYVRVWFAKAWGYLATDPPFNVTNATAIAVGNAGLGAGSGHYLVLKSDGKIASWSGGFVTFGETNVAALSNATVTAIAAGYEDSLALKSDSTVYAWGDDINGETNVPAGLSSVTAIACGNYHDLALKADGTVVGWGQNTYFQTTNAAATNVVAIAASGEDSIALRSDGSVVAWGFYGPYLPGLIPFNVTNVIAIAAGGSHYLALRANGTVVGWGNNGYGQATIPAGISNIVAISAGANHSILLRNDGTVVALGAYTGSVGLSSISPPSDLANVVAIASSGDHDLALFGTRAPAFTVQPWSRTVFNTATSVWFSAKCAGVQPVSYQWQFNGTNLPAATNDTLTVHATITNTYAQKNVVLPLQSGVYQLIASNAYGVVASKYAQLTVLIPLGVALNATNLNWTTTGEAKWFGETNITHDGVSAAQSGDIGPLQETILQSTVGTNWSGHYTFWWKVSSELDFDFLEFRINGIVQTNISGEVDWQPVSLPVAAGTNVLMWRYSKESIYGSGLDAGWVDQFAFVPDPPKITQQPPSQTNWLGANATFQASAIWRGIAYVQWLKNGINLPDAHSVTLTLTNLTRQDSGVYALQVTNVDGSTVSSNAVLKVLVPQALASPTLLPNGSFQLTSTDANGGLLSPANLANFEAQASTNLMNWVTLPNALSLTNGMLLLQDRGPSNFTARYYRIIEH